MEKNIAYIDPGEGQISFGKKNFNHKNSEKMKIHFLELIFVPT